MLPVLLAACSSADPAVSAGEGVDRSHGPTVPGSAGPGSAYASSGAGSPATTRGAVEVVRTWDRERARAFADGDVAALRELYVTGSTAGASDVALLEAYLRRGVRVEGMQMQLLAVEVLREEGSVLRVRVTDRLTGAEAVGRGARTELPRDRASTRVVELRRSRDGEWQVATVRESARRPVVR